MSVKITGSKDLPYNHANGFAIEGVEAASYKLQKILEKIKINGEDIEFKINSNPTNGLSFFNVNCDEKFFLELGELEEDIQETNIDIKDFDINNLTCVDHSNIPKDYQKLRDAIIKYIKQLIEDKEEHV